MDKSILRTAIQNNALWCDLVCRAHNSEGEFLDAFWVNSDEVPLLYPNFITLQPFKNHKERLEQLSVFLQENENCSISVKDSYKELAMWTAAWSDEDRDLEETFPSLLLEEGDVYFLGEFNNSQITKGAIVFQTDDSIGVSNVFSQNSTDSIFWRELVDNMRFNFPDTLLVGYETGKSLACALDAGFESCGKLSVWAR